MTLTNQQKKFFRSIAHSLKPTVTIAGNGLSEPVLAEINRALDDHELIKIKLAVGDRQQRRQLMEAICRSTNSQVVQMIGRVIVILRETKTPKANLSNLPR